MNDYEVINNEKNMQFEVHIDDSIGVLQYRYYKNDLALMHTEVPDEIEGKGVASHLAQYAFEWAKERNLKVRVYCPYVAAYLKRHPEYNQLVSELVE